MGSGSVSGAMGDLNVKGAAIVNPQPVNLAGVSMAAAPYPGIPEGAEGVLRPQDFNILRLLYVSGPLTQGQLMQQHEAGYNGQRFPLAYDAVPKLMQLQYVTRIVSSPQVAARTPGATYRPNINADWYLTKAGYDICRKQFPSVSPWKPTQGPAMEAAPAHSPAPMHVDDE